MIYYLEFGITLILHLSHSYRDLTIFGKFCWIFADLFNWNNRTKIIVLFVYSWTLMKILQDIDGSHSDNDYAKRMCGSGE